MKSVKEADVTGKKVLLRADLDGPVEVGLEETLPTIKFLIEKNAKVILAGHLGRPEGKVVEKLRLDPVAEKLREYLPATHKDVLLLENLRFHPGETGNDPDFAKELASLADLFVNDCFAASHREHASIVGVPQLLPSYAGLQLVEETTILCSVVKNPKRPLLIIVGGAKAETKAPLVRKLSKIADKALLGGTLMFEQSLEGIPNVIFPIDTVGIEDIGPETIKMFVDEIKKAKTVIWNGPMGIIDTKEFKAGTRAIAEALAESKAHTVVGGGDTVAALTRFGLRDKMDFVSTGGGAMLQFLAEGTLPGLEVLGWKKL